MLNQKPEPVSDQEIENVLKDAWPQALSSYTIATRIWHQRGGEGDPIMATRHRQPRVPVVRAKGIEPLLASLVERGVLTSAKGTEAGQLGTPVETRFRPKSTYYALTSLVEAWRSRNASDQTDQPNARS